MNKIIAIDRDGVLFDTPEGQYVNKVSDIKYIHQSLDAIVRLQRAGFTPVLVTNQAGIAYGYTKHEDYMDINLDIQKRLISVGGETIKIFTCPHSKEARCGCRKPQAGLLYKAEGFFNGKVRYMIGDYYTDIVAGKSINAKTMLVMTGRGCELRNIEYFEANPHNMFDYCVSDLAEAVDLILSEFAFNIMIAHKQRGHYDTN